MVSDSKAALANWQNLLKIFTVPEGPESTLTKIDAEISRNLDNFLQQHVVAEEKPLSEIERDFSYAQVPEAPEFVSTHTEHLLSKVVAHSVHTSSPHFIGHMTSALPYFLMPLSKIMIALNQNLVKIETSKAFTPLERHVLGMLHHLVYQQSNAFYDQWMHSSAHSLGAFCSGGTIANITALWVARNNALRADGNFAGVEKAGLISGLLHYGYKGMAVVVSERGHYSLKKAADLLGLGQDGLITVAVDENNRIITSELEQTLDTLKQQSILPIAVVGIAGTTETGSIDPLDEMAQICRKHQVHFHVDAAWGGATLMSNTHRKKLTGIEEADSVTIDAHKQLYIPMGAGMVLFKSPDATHSIEHHAQYILRQGSKDLGCRTIEGSRSGMAMLVYSALHIIGRQGYEILIDHSLEKTRYFANLIEEQDDFQLISQPELCLLTYRFAPKDCQQALERANPEQFKRLNTLLNDLTVFVQKRQRESGHSFVSRTQLTPSSLKQMQTNVFRVVLANPLTTQEILQQVLAEQRKIAAQAKSILENIKQIVANID